MADPNELLDIIRTNLSTPTALSAFDQLDAECKAGNLPEEWQNGAVARLIKRHCEQDEEKDKRITELEGERDEVSVDCHHFKAKVERLRATIERLEAVIENRAIDAPPTG